MLLLQEACERASASTDSRPTLAGLDLERAK
jgi:hypothetical protein